MNVKCQTCGGDNVVDEKDYQPGQTVTVNCWKCGGDIEVIIPGTPVPTNAKSNQLKSSHEIAKQNREISANTESIVSESTTDAELEKARLILEAERIKLEHRKLDHEAEMKKQAQQYTPVPPQPVYNAAPAYQEPVGTKSKSTAGILAILLGGFGIHKFYLGKSGMGILYLLFCWTYIPAIIGFIEGIGYFCQSDVDFARKYG